jgi:hypothetical protein
MAQYYIGCAGQAHRLSAFSRSFLPSSPHQPVLLSRPFSTVRRLHGCKSGALLLFVPVASDAAAVSGAGPPQKAAIGAVETMEETMRVLTLNELMRLTRAELCALAAQITAALPTFREGSPQRTAAYINLGNIRAVLARRDFSP